MGGWQIWAADSQWLNGYANFQMWEQDTARRQMTEREREKRESKKEWNNKDNWKEWLFEEGLV